MNQCVGEQSLFARQSDEEHRQVCGVVDVRAVCKRETGCCVAGLQVIEVDYRVILFEKFERNETLPTGIPDRDRP